ncbi:cytochrome C551 [Chryseobacterium sp. G0186]|uniref:cytochrome C551 n=1 Tax=Chryseobacterium sp. G0186 TaxID=2487064 RepID=UPI000F4E8970|nr:cytochrome C551 [Chryseobacterium sp. G0186]AZA77361.1 cytochrome C551 [Chryseobacterium sp. G0186]
MKKLLLTAIGVGLFAVSCGTKESSMSTGSSDSTAVGNTQKVSPSTTDTMTTKAVNPDSIKMKKDSMVTTPAK